MTDFFREERLLIDGELVQATGGRSYENINPATEEVIGVAADARPEDIERAVAAARRAFDETDWSRDHKLRARCLRQLRDAFQENLENLRASGEATVDAERIMIPVDASVSRIVGLDTVAGGTLRKIIGGM